MTRISESDIIKRAEDYIKYIIDLNKKEPEFKELNKKAYSDFEELQGYMSIYKYGAPKYKKYAFDWIKQIFG